MKTYRNYVKWLAQASYPEDTQYSKLKRRFRLFGLFLIVSLLLYPVGWSYFTNSPIN